MIMSKEEIQENSHIIALFMGATLDYYSPEDRGAVKCVNDVWYSIYGDIVEGMSWWNFDQVEDKYLPPIDEWFVAEDELQYHCSWDWLIPVLQKIHSVRKNYMVEIAPPLCVIMQYDNECWKWGMINNYEFTLQGVYQAIIECIKLINNEEK